MSSNSRFFDDHLLVDAPVVLRPAGDLGVDAQLGQPGLDHVEDLADVDVALGRPHRHHLLDLGVALGVEGGEGQVLQLQLDAGDAEAVGQGGVDVERLLGRAVLVLDRHGRDRAHVVEAVGQLDEQDPDVLGHGHQHLAHGGGLLGLLGVEADPVELGDAVDDGRHLGAEVADDVVEADAGVLDRVVQEGGGEGDVVEAEVGEDGGHGQRVLDVGVARTPQLAPWAASAIS